MERCAFDELAFRDAYTTLQSLIPVVMSGIIAVYGLVVSVLIAGGRKLSCIVPLHLWLNQFCTWFGSDQLILHNRILYMLDLSILWLDCRVG